MKPLLPSPALQDCRIQTGLQSQDQSKQHNQISLKTSWYLRGTRQRPWKSLAVNNRASRNFKGCFSQQPCRESQVEKGLSGPVDDTSV